MNDLYTLKDKDNNEIGVFSVEIHSQGISTCPLLPLQDNIYLKGLGKNKVYLSHGYRLIKA